MEQITYRDAETKEILHGYMREKFPYFLDLALNEANVIEWCSGWHDDFSHCVALSWTLNLDEKPTDPIKEGFMELIARTSSLTKKEIESSIVIDGELLEDSKAGIEDSPDKNNLTMSAVSTLPVKQRASTGILSSLEAIGTDPKVEKDIEFIENLQPEKKKMPDNLFAQ